MNIHSKVKSQQSIVYKQGFAWLYRLCGNVNLASRLQYLHFKIRIYVQADLFCQIL